MKKTALLLALLSCPSLVLAGWPDGSGSRTETLGTIATISAIGTPLGLQPFPATGLPFSFTGLFAIYMLIACIVLTACHLNRSRNKGLAILFSFLLPTAGQLYFKAKYNAAFFILILAVQSGFKAVINPYPGPDLDSAIVIQLIVSTSSAVVMLLRTRFQRSITHG